MVLCIILFVLLLGYRKRILDKKVWKILFFSNLLAMLLFVLAWVRDRNLSEVERNAYGEGNRKETYLVTVDGILEEEEITVEFQEQRYTQEEIQTLFSDVMEKLDKLILADNESKDRIVTNLNLPVTLEEYPVGIRWEMDRYDIIATNGALILENLIEEGSLVELRGILTYQDQEAVYVTSVMVYPGEKSEREKWILDIQKSFAEADKQSREEKTVPLPKIVAGEKVKWKEEKDQRGYVILVSGTVIAGLMIYGKRQDEKERERKRQQQMLLDYPEIVSKFAMLLGTGMTVRNTWNKIVQTYEEEKMSGKNRFAYEEMCLTSHEMQSGVSEREAYEKFGKHCACSSYIRFSMLLSQNLRKGSKGLSELLKVESIQALEQRKQNAKKRGEEAGTKLLLPMFLMFAIVLVIVMIPAFLSIQI